MMSVQEAAESLAGSRATLGDVETLKGYMVEGLVSIGVSPEADFDFDGPRRRTVYSIDDAVEHLLKKYVGGCPNAGDAIKLSDSIRAGLLKIGYNISDL